jgi:arginine N-succinyltransferase
MSPTTSDYRVRPVRQTDIDDFRTLRVLAGPGFTSLMAADAVLENRLAQAAKAFATAHKEPGPQRYWMALEHLPSGQVVGSAAVKSSIGDHPPFFNFRMLQIAQASAAAGRRFDLDVLILVNEFTRCSEVGSLFVTAEHRVAGVGRMLAQSRYLLMAAAPERFAPVVVSELRGVVDAEGRSPFWEAVGRHFFQMDFAEADRLSAATDNQFILDLMPKYPIYVDVLPKDARAVIGECHPQGRGALALLQWEGFAFDRVVDVFDGGPLVSCPRDSIRTFREARRLPCMIAESPDEAAKPALIANPAVNEFAAVSGLAHAFADHVRIDPASAQALGVRSGQEVLIHIGEARR